MRSFFRLCLCALVLFPFARAFAAPSTAEQAVREISAALAAKDVDVIKKLVDVHALSDVSYAGRYAESRQFAVLPDRQYQADMFIERVASGTLARQCAEATRPGCPWYPDGLVRAQIKAVGTNGAIAAVDSKENIRSWLVLHKDAQGWKAVAAPRLLKDAEQYTTEDFQKALQRYRAAMSQKQAEQQKLDVAYTAELAKAVGQAKGILAAVTVGKFSFAVDKDDTFDSLTISATVTNTHSEQINLVQMSMLVLDASGKPVTTMNFNTRTGYIEPGKSGPLKLSTSIRGTAKMVVAKNLANGAYTAKGSATYVLMAGNVHVDANGGGLKPSRKSAY